MVPSKMVAYSEIKIKPIMFIIPQDHPMIVSRQMDPVQVVEVHVGPEAALRFVDFDQRINPEVFGLVTTLPADVFTDLATELSYYQVELVPSVDEIAKLGGQTPLLGTPVEAFTKNRRTISAQLLVQPLTDYFARLLFVQDDYPLSV